MVLKHAVFLLEIKRVWFHSKKISFSFMWTITDPLFRSNQMLQSLEDIVILSILRIGTLAPDTIKDQAVLHYKKVQTI